MKLKAKIFNANKPNANNVVYDADALKEAVENYNKVCRYAVGGEYPPKDLKTPVESLVGEVKLDYKDGVVTATIDLLDVKKAKILEVFEDCAGPIKILPTCLASVTNNSETVAKDITIATITCTCLPVDTGDDEEMFIAEKIDDDTNE